MSHKLPASDMFPSLNHIREWLEIHTFLFFKCEFYTAIFVLIVTTFHLAVMTRKTILTSSVMSVMIGIAMCDWVSMTIVVGGLNVIANYFRDECTPPASLFSLKTLYIALSVRDDVIRCFTWLSVLMTLIRLLTVKAHGKSHYQSVRLGFCAVGVSFVISSVMSVLRQLKTKTVEIGTWTPGNECALQADNEETYILTEQQSSDFFNSFFLRVFNFVNGFSTRILPCVLLPVLTIFLVLEIQYARKKVATTRSAVRKRTERTTTLVILMAVTFFIANLPSGIFTFIQVIYTDIGFLKIAVFVDRFCNAISTVNAIIHCIICCIMSTEYRNTAKKLLRIRQKKQISTTFQ